MIVIKIMNEFLHSPIWTYEDGFITDDYPIITEDIALQEISKQIENDSHEQACWFNQEKEKSDKDHMLELISKLYTRLNEINDGSYLVEDLETERLINL